MNKERRSRIAAACDELEALLGHVENAPTDAQAATAFWADADSKAADIVSTVESIRDDEQEAYDNMPESFQQGERGEASQAAIEALQSAADMLGSPLSDDKDDAENTIQSAIDYLNEAQA